MHQVLVQDERRNLHCDLCPLWRAFLLLMIHKSRSNGKVLRLLTPTRLPERIATHFNAEGVANGLGAIRGNEFRV